MSPVRPNASLAMVPEDLLPSAWTGHLPFAFWLVEETRPGILVELGTHNGTSFLAFCQAIKAHDVATKAFAVDTWEGDPQAGYYGDEVHDRLEAVVRAKYAGFAQLMRMLFDDALPYFSDGSVDLLHIDGLHTYEAVRHDFETWLPKMSARGVVIFHDTMVRERGFGVWKLWEELRGRYPSFEFKHTHGLGVLLVGDEPPESLRALCALSGSPDEAILSNFFGALGQRLSLLDSLARLEERTAVAVQHAANYQQMYEEADAALRRAMDTLGAQMEVRAKDVQSASEQIAGLMARLEAMRADFRVQLAIAREQAGLAPSDADAAEPAQALAALMQALQAREGEGARPGTAAHAAQTLLAGAESRLEAALARLDEVHARHEGELAAFDARLAQALSSHVAGFEGERQSLEQALAQAREAATAELQLALQRQESLQAALQSATEQQDALQAALRLATEQQDAMQVALRRQDALQARHQQDLAEADARFAEQLAALRDGFQSLLSAERARAEQEAGVARERFELESSALRAEHATREAALRASLSEQAARQAELRDGLRARESEVQDLRVRLSLSENQVQRLAHSLSWRVTAPLRWLRGAWSALRSGQPVPAYAAVRGVPAAGGRAAAGANATPLLAAGRAAAGDYLQSLFAGAVSPRAPGYRGPADAPAAPPAALRAKAIAFYLPQFHAFPENEAWWGPGFTEWTNVTRAVPQFVGHEQPQLPADLGFYDLRVPGVMQRQVALARLYGIHAFCFHYYWFGGKRLMEAPLESFLAQPDIDFPFCLCWANENWTRRWDGRDDEVLISQVHGPQNDLAFIRDLERYLRDPRYLRIDGRPLVVVYRASLLPDAAATVARWREHCREAGIGEIFVAMVQFDTEDPTPFGFDAAMEFPPHKLANGFERINDAVEVVNPDYQGSVFHYQSIVDSAKAWPDRGFPLIRAVFPGWDNEARRPGKGYTFAFSTPERYRSWLASAVEYAERHPVAGEKIVMINAWNEWAEGAKLEPDSRHGHAYLHATRQALSSDPADDGTAA